MSLFSLRTHSLAFLVTLLAIGCGSSSDTNANDGNGNANGNTGVGDTNGNGSNGTGANGNGSNGSGGNGTSTTTTLLGVWRVSGTDSRGAYTGAFELRDAGGGKIQAIRAIDYTSATVEGGRSLSWAWTGTATATASGYSVSVSLARADFVRSRGGITRTDADKVPLAVTGAIAAGANGAATATWSATGLAITDALSARVDSGATPIFAIDRTATPVNAAPTGTTKSTLDSTYASYRSLPEVAPYANDPLFQAGVCDVIVDKTDFDLYRAHPNALRVVNKVIDAPSLGETLARADAYGPTLAAKAAAFDAKVPVDSIDATGMLVDDTSNGVMNPTGDGSLWTSAYVASQAYRYLVTKDATVIPNLAKSAAAIQVLMEITPDQTTFARTIRPASGNATGTWHAGAGAYAAYDWLEGGNNDMFKGLFYGTLTAYVALCDPIVSGQEALCARMQKNAKHMLADIALAQSVQDSNHMIAAWLSAYANNDSGALTKTIESWSGLHVSVENANVQMREMATADWSGTHLNFVSFAAMHLLAQKKSLIGFDANASIRTGVETMRGNFQVFRMGMWSILFYELAGTPDPKDADDARWRMRELSGPKEKLDVDHRVGADFVMSPYPSAPWKNDWTTTDRSSSLHGYPMFEVPADVYVWRSGPFDYRIDTEGAEFPGADYLHAYWIGRYLGLFSATE